MFKPVVAASRDVGVERNVEHFEEISLPPISAEGDNSLDNVSMSGPRVDDLSGGQVPASSPESDRRARRRLKDFTPLE